MAQKPISQLPDNPTVQDTDRYGTDKIGGETVNSTLAQIKADIVNTLLGLGGEQVGSLLWAGQANPEFYAQLSDGLTDFEKADFPELILNNSPNDGNWEALYGSQPWFIGSDGGKFRLPPAALAGLFLRATSSTFGHSLGDLTPNKTRQPVIPFNVDASHTPTAQAVNLSGHVDFLRDTGGNFSLLRSTSGVFNTTGSGGVSTSAQNFFEFGGSHSTDRLNFNFNFTPVINPVNLSGLPVTGGDNETAPQALTQNLFVLMKPKLAFAPPPAGVSSFNGRLGAVLPILGDYHGEILTITSSDSRLIKDYIDANDGQIIAEIIDVTTPIPIPNVSEGVIPIASPPVNIYFEVVSNVIEFLLPDIPLEVDFDMNMNKSSGPQTFVQVWLQDSADGIVFADLANSLREQLVTTDGGSIRFTFAGDSNLARPFMQFVWQAGATNTQAVLPIPLNGALGTDLSFTTRFMVKKL